MSISSDLLFGGPPFADPVDGADHVRGASSSLVTLVEYADFECLNCARAFPLLVRYLDEFQRHAPSRLPSLSADVGASGVVARARAPPRPRRVRESSGRCTTSSFGNPGMLHREALHAHAASAGLDIVRFAATWRTRAWSHASSVTSIVAAEARYGPLLPSSSTAPAMSTQETSRACAMPSWRLRCAPRRAICESRRRKSRG